MGKGIPKGWLNCPRKGLLVQDKFIALKTPLDATRYAQALPEASTFTPSNFFEWMSILKLKIGLWIDLTNTTRYYNPQEIEDHSVHYRKMALEGHGIPPRKHEVKQFCNLVDEYQKYNSAKRLVAVHCTHGFNRTGYLIVSYLVERCKLSVEDALEEFATSRPPGIYRQEYVTDLIEKYHPGAVAPIVRQPDWVEEVKRLSVEPQKEQKDEVPTENRKERRERIRKERNKSKPVASNSETLATTIPSESLLQRKRRPERKMSHDERYHKEKKNNATAIPGEKSSSIGPVKEIKEPKEVR